MKTIVLYAFVLLALVNAIHGQPNPEEKKQICEPGTRSKVECNTCTCSQDGTALGCTRMACPKIPAEYLNPDGSLKLPHQSNPLLRTKRDQVCSPGTERTWKCNTCRCSPDGTAEICTRKVCPELSRQTRDISCTPNESFKQDCNTCFCSADGRSAGCTLMACLSSNSPLLRTKRDQVCTPGTSRVWQCNNCRCSPDGTAEICTRKICPAVPRDRRDVPFSCVPHSNFMQDCNNCVCSSDGRSAGCTLKFCIPDSLVAQISQPKIAQ